MMLRGDRTMSANHSPQSAEAPELSTSPQSEVVFYYRNCYLTVDKNNLDSCIFIIDISK